MKVLCKGNVFFIKKPSFLPFLYILRCPILIKGTLFEDKIEVIRSTDLITSMMGSE